MSNDHRVLVGLLVCGLVLFLASFWNGGVNDSRHELTTDKAKEIQQARREYHRLSHHYAHRATGSHSGANSDDQNQEFDDAQLRRAEKRFHTLQAEIEAIRNSRPWLTELLRYSAITMFAASGLLLWISQRPVTLPDDESEWR